MQFKENQSEQKLRGGYYTPLDLAVFISKWVTAPADFERILEPSCGDGIFFEAISSIGLNRRIQVNAFEIERTEAAKASQRAKALSHLLNAEVDVSDFLEWALDRPEGKTLFDGVVGNPPFIRYQYLPSNAQILAERIFLRYRLPFTRHTNAWVPFVIASLGLLNPGGRLGMIIPAEILHVMHAQPLRSFLGRNCRRMLILDPEDLWFDGTLQGAVILLAEKKRDPKEKSLGLGIVRTYGREFLKKEPESYFKSTDLINGRTVENKWTRALLTKEELEIFEAVCGHERVFPFREIAKVDVGIVTGANNFFLVPDCVVKSYRLEKWAHPMFGRSEHCPGIIYNKKQHETNTAKGLPTNFLWFNVSGDEGLSTSARQYITEGEKQNLPARYKCRIRQPWYKVPSVYASAIGMLKRAHDIPRLIYNDLGAYTTDTAYRIATIEAQPQKLVSCFVNSLTALSAELEGRHYGGGVLELVPSEIEQLVVPIPRNTKTSLEELDNLVRIKPVQEVLSIQDATVLAGIGLTRLEQKTLLSAWNRLRMRRQRNSDTNEG